MSIWLTLALRSIICIPVSSSKTSFKISVSRTIGIISHVGNLISYARITNSNGYLYTLTGDWYFWTIFTQERDQLAVFCYNIIKHNLQNVLLNPSSFCANIKVELLSSMYCITLNDVQRNVFFVDSPAVVEMAKLFWWTCLLKI